MMDDGWTNRFGYVYGNGYAAETFSSKAINLTATGSFFELGTVCSLFLLTHSNKFLFVIIFFSLIIHTFTTSDFFAS